MIYVYIYIHRITQSEKNTNNSLYEEQKTFKKKSDVSGRFNAHKQIYKKNGPIYKTLFIRQFI